MDAPRPAAQSPAAAGGPPLGASPDPAGAKRTPDGWLSAGRVGRAHGLDGSFHVVEPRVPLLDRGAALTIDGRRHEIVRRAGTDARPIVRLDGCTARGDAELLRGRELLVARADAPPLEEDEWWPEELEGCRVFDGAREVGVVRALRALPSCEILEVDRTDGGEELLVPLIRDAVRAVDVDSGRIDVDLAFLGETDEPAAGLAEDPAAPLPTDAVGSSDAEAAGLAEDPAAPPAGPAARDSPSA